MTEFKVNGKLCTVTLCEDVLVFEENNAKSGKSATSKRYEIQILNFQIMLLVQL